MTLAPVVRASLTIAAIVLGTHLLSLPTPLSGPSPAEAFHAPIEGFGAITKGGTGKPECVVTSRGDSGPGTLRECLSAGNRYVKFSVTGEIQLQSKLNVRGANVTIDGFTAPSPGITLRGQGLWMVDSGVHDIIVTGIRVRDTEGESSGDCISVYGRAYNIVIDHVSVANCGDGGIDVSQGPRNVTIQWSIISDNKAMLIGTTGGGVFGERYSIHHNLLPAGVDRMPLVRPSGNQATDTTADIRNNLFRGWLRANATKLETGTWANLVGNTYIPAPETTPYERSKSVGVWPGTRVYTAGNVELGPRPQMNYNTYGNISSPLPAPPITARPAGCLLEHAGVRPLDAVDRQLLAPLASVELPPCPDDPTPPPPGSGGSTGSPDLTVRSVSAPNTGAPGQPLSVSMIIANVGTAPAAASTTRLYFANGSTQSGSDVLLGSLSVPALGAGATHTATTSVTLPAATAPGAYTLRVQTDAGLVVAESSEVNNTVAMLVTVGAVSGLADLVVTEGSSCSAVGQQNVVVGAPFNVEFTVENQGGAPSAESAVRLYLSRDSTLSSDDVYFRSMPIPGLAPTATHSLSNVSVTVPNSVAPGTYYLLYVVDGRGSIPESKEGNNTRARSLRVQ